MQINKKGQALIEFVLLLPILIMLILFIIDMGIILYNQSSLENKIGQVYDLYVEEKFDKIDNILDKNIEFKENKGTDYIEISISKEINVITPGLNLILGNPYIIKIKRVISNE